MEARRRPVKRAGWRSPCCCSSCCSILADPVDPAQADRRRLIDRELARRNVQATYEVKRIGFRTQRLENLVIGDPRDPDLTARWVEVACSWGLGGPRWP